MPGGRGLDKQYIRSGARDADQAASKRDGDNQKAQARKNVWSGYAKSVLPSYSIESAEELRFLTSLAEDMIEEMDMSHMSDEERLVTEDGISCVYMANIIPNYVIYFDDKADPY